MWTRLFLQQMAHDVLRTFVEAARNLALDTALNLGALRQARAVFAGMPRDEQWRFAVRYRAMSADERREMRLMFLRGWADELAARTRSASVPETH